MSKIEVDAIDKQSGSTLTIGGSGTAVTLACGATQTGFGRTGTVNWITTKKTTAFTAANGEGYFVDTAASGAVTMTLPASPSAGNIVGVKDYNGNFGTANLTIARNGSPINGGSVADVTISTAGASIFLVYVDATQGWVATQDDASTFSGESFISATGGTITACGADRIHTFTGPGTFCVSSLATCAANNLVSYLVVAGGGAAAGIGSNNSSMGGGGAGGFRETKSPSTTYTASPLDGYPTPSNRITVTATNFPITVGAGGSGGSSGLGNMGTSGGVSTFSTISSAGGGFGSGYQSPGPGWVPGATGGSGGGGGFCRNGSAGNTPSTTPPQGNAGGNGLTTPGKCGSAGGGGAGAAGTSPPGSCHGVVGGIGAVTGIAPASGTPGPQSGRYFAGGGSGAPFQQPPSIPGTAGGGGGNTNGPSGGAGENGTDNTGGGAGGTNSAPGQNFGGANGGSGIVVIRYKVQ
jgi:hypothetical protein